MDTRDSLRGSCTAEAAGVVRSVPGRQDPTPSCRHENSRVQRMAPRARRRPAARPPPPPKHHAPQRPPRLTRRRQWAGFWVTSILPNLSAAASPAPPSSRIGRPIFNTIADGARRRLSLMAGISSVRKSRAAQAADCTRTRAARSAGLLPRSGLCCNRSGDRAACPKPMRRCFSRSSQVSVGQGESKRPVAIDFPTGRFVLRPPQDEIGQAGASNEPRACGR